MGGLALLLSAFNRRMNFVDVMECKWYDIHKMRVDWERERYY